MAYQTLRRTTSSPADWQTLWVDQGCKITVRVALPLPDGRHMEMYLFLKEVLEHRGAAAEIAWLGMSLWPEIKAWMEETALSLTTREHEALKLAFRGHTVEESARQMDCQPRTVTWHLTQVMEKLGVDRKLEAMHRACWLGII